MDAATVALSLNEENVSEITVASLEGLSVPIVIVDVLKGHCFFILGGHGGAFKNLSAEPII